MLPCRCTRRTKTAKTPPTWCSPAVPADLAGHLSSVWETPFRAAGADRADVFHLHHLTPQHDAVRRCWPAGCRRRPPPRHRDQVPPGGQRARRARQVGGNDAGRHARLGDGPTRAGAPSSTIPSASCCGRPVGSTGEHGEAWRDRLRRQAAAADHLVVVSPTDRATAVEVLGVDPERVSDVPNGVDVIRFCPRPMSPSRSAEHTSGAGSSRTGKAGTRPQLPARSPTASRTSTASWAPTATPSC